MRTNGHTILASPPVDRATAAGGTYTVRQGNLIRVALVPGRPPVRSSVPRVSDRDGDPATRLSVGLCLLVAVALFGALVAGSGSPTPLDHLGFALVPASQNGLWRAVAKLGSTVVLIAGCGLVAVVALARGRRRWTLTIATCLVAPALAVGAAELAKGVVGRRLSDVPCYPSGTVAVIAVVAAAAALAARGPARAALSVLGGVAVVMVAVAVVALRWHYPTDAVAGAALGIGSVLVADGLFGLLTR